MKTLALFLLLLTSFNCFAQKDKLTDSIPTINGNYEYQEIIKVDSSIKKDELYKNAKVYFVESYKSAKDVIQYDEKSEGRIIGKGLFIVKDAYDAFLAVTPYTWEINFTTEITCKDGRYRYRFYNISIKQYRGGQYPSTTNLSLNEAFEDANKGPIKKLFTRLLNSTMTEFRKEQVSLKQYMQKTNSTAANDNF